MTFRSRISSPWICAGRVIASEGVDPQFEEVVLCLGERLRVGSHLSNVIDRCSGDAENGMADFDEVLRHDRERLMAHAPGKPIKHGEHRSGGRILDGDNESVDFTVLQG